MTEKTTKPRTRRNTAKKEIAKDVKEDIKEVETVEDNQQEDSPKEETPKVEEKPKRQKRKEIDRNELIACRSSVNGRLIYISPRTKEKFIWSEFGSVEYVEMGELLTMKSSSPKFLKDVKIIIDDEEAAEYLGMTKVYEDMVQIDELDEVFTKTPDELAKLLTKLPKGLRKAVATRARELAESGELDSFSKIKLIENALDVEIQMFMKQD